MTIESKLINYLAKCSNGKVKLSHHAAATIVEMVINNPQHKVILYRYCYIKKDYEIMRTVETNKPTIERLQQQLIYRQVECNYRYDLYNDKNVLLGQLYTLNNDLI